MTRWVMLIAFGTILALVVLLAGYCLGLWGVDVIEYCSGGAP